MTIYLNATGTSLPPRVSTLNDIEAGLVQGNIARRTGISSTSQADASGAEMAATAGARAFENSGLEIGLFKLCLHASAFHQGYDMWSSAAFVQNEALPGSTALALDVGQLSNGGLASLEVAEQYLRGSEDPAAALLTAGDRFCLPGVDRWSTDPGTVFGDGGSAAVFSTTPGLAEVLSIRGLGAPWLERMSRGADAPSDSPLGHRRPIEISAGRRLLVEDIGLEELLSVLQKGQLDAYRSALSAVDVAPESISWHIVPHLGLPKMRHQFLEPLNIDVNQTNWSWGSGVGHLGAGDQWAGLNWLIESELIRPGDLCAVHGAGGGFYWSCALLRFL